MYIYIYICISMCTHIFEHRVVLELANKPCIGYTYVYIYCECVYIYTHMYMYVYSHLRAQGSR